MSVSKSRQGQYQPSGCWIRPVKRLAIYLRDGFTCLYCGTDLRNSTPQDVTLDHLITKSEGGSNSESNLVTACKKCNSSRGAKSLVEFAPGGALERIYTARYLPLNMELAKAIMDGTAGDYELETNR